MPPPAASPAAVASSLGGLGAAVLRPAAEFDDLVIRAIGIPAFGIAVPRLVGLLDHVAITQPAYWAGSAWSIFVVAVVCHATRWIYFQVRRQRDWVTRPLREAAILFAAVVGCTGPLAALAVAGWNLCLDTEERHLLVPTVAVAVGCVVLVIPMYEVALLRKERAGDQARVVTLERACACAELVASRARIEPHFLCNSLAALHGLIAVDPRRAILFADHLARLHRRLLEQCRSSHVRLGEELVFLADYVALMKLRFGAALVVRLRSAGVDLAAHLPPATLQILVENAVKHNHLSRQHPLVVTIELRASSVCVHNPLRLRRQIVGSAGMGLQTLDEQLRATAGGGLTVRQRDGQFAVTVPLGTP
jgi:Histidine kinase